MADAATYVIIPGRNEERYLGKTIAAARRHGYRRIIYVDDGSTDKSASIARKARAVVLIHPRNRGKGAALRSGCDEAVRRGARKLILMDADGQHDPKDLAAIERLLRSRPLVYAYRRFSSEMPKRKRIGNILFSVLFRLLYGVRVRDPLCGYRGLTREAYRQVRWGSDGYQVETEIIIRGWKADLRHAEHPVPTIYHDLRKGTTPFHGLPILWDLLKWRFSRR